MSSWYPMYFFKSPTHEGNKRKRSKLNQVFTWTFNRQKSLKIFKWRSLNPTYKYKKNYKKVKIYWFCIAFSFCPGCWGVAREYLGDQAYRNKAWLPFGRMQSLHIRRHALMPFIFFCDFYFFFHFSPRKWW